jgi:hypothetical protein
VQATSTTAAPTTTVSLADLRERLLTAGEVGAGWKPETEITAADLGGIGELPCSGVPDLAINPTIAARLVAATGIIMSPTDGTPRGIKEILVTGEPDRLSRDLDAVIGATTDNCIGKDLVTKDHEKVRMEVVALDGIGDQRSAVTVTVGEPPDYQSTWRGYQAVVRVGPVAMMISTFQVMGTPDAKPVMDEAGFVALVKQAVAKLSP